MVLRNIGVLFLVVAVAFLGYNRYVAYQAM